MHGQRGHFQMSKTRLIGVYHQLWEKQHVTGSTTGYPSRNQRVDRTDTRMGGHQTASRMVSKALSDTRRGRQVGPEATSSIIRRHPDSYTLVHPGAQSFLGQLTSEMRIRGLWMTRYGCYPQKNIHYHACTLLSYKFGGIRH